MAAIVPATPLIAWLHATAAAAGLDFDVALANASPDAEGRLPGPTASAPYLAPAPAVPLAPGAAVPGCADRPHHMVTPASNPCLGAANPGEQQFQSHGLYGGMSRL